MNSNHTIIHCYMQSNKYTILFSQQSKAIYNYMGKDYGTCSYISSGFYKPQNFIITSVAFRLINFWGNARDNNGVLCHRYG